MPCDAMEGWHQGDGSPELLVCLEKWPNSLGYFQPGTIHPGCCSRTMWRNGGSSLAPLLGPRGALPLRGLRPAVWVRMRYGLGAQNLVPFSRASEQLAQPGDTLRAPDQVSEGPCKGLT